MDSGSLLIKPEVAQKQIEDEEPVEVVEELPPENLTLPPNTTAEAGLPKRFYASVALDPDRVGRDAGRAADEILSHLSVLPGARVKVTMEIEAETPKGVSEDVQRTVSENASVLKFDSYGFERF
jgi:hypothetical protein